MAGSLRYLMLLHLIVFIFGFTGILGKLITLDALPLVWHRMLIGAAAIGAWLVIRGRLKRTASDKVIRYLLTGLIIAAHWSTFFGAIKASTVSIGLVCVSCGAGFTAILEPLFFKRRIRVYELGLAGCIIVGMGLIFAFETEYATGIMLGVTSAFLAALFSVINAGFIKEDSSANIALYELIGGVLGLTLLLLVTGGLSAPMFDLPASDWLWIACLGVICTGFAFVALVEVMRELSPFTVNLSINLEPVYGIFMAFFIFGEEEHLSAVAYAGMALILAAIFMETWLKQRDKRKLVPTTYG